jgi:hypothetical protein
MSKRNCHCVSNNPVIHSSNLRNFQFLLKELFAEVYKKEIGHHEGKKMVLEYFSQALDRDQREGQQSY